MPNSSLSVVVQQLRAAAGRDGAGRTDGELLTHFLSRQDGDALAALVERHAPMVWGVCCRVLRNPLDAEDAFQATFLVLVQKAATVIPRDMVANWLHGVAHQTAVRLRATAAKRGWREVQMDAMPEPAVAEARDEELLSRLDEELGRLPERCRALIVLCDLEGRTRKEVAQHLGCPEGTVASGLARARELLAKRLSQRGLAVSGGSLAATLSHSVASADVPASVVTSAINVATLLAAGKAAGVISGPVAMLTQGVLKTMVLKKILTTTVAVLALGVAVILGGSLAVGQTDGKPAVGKDVKAPVAEKPVEPVAKQEKEIKEPEVAWGKEIDGLQLGLALVPAGKTTYRPGETIEFGVYVRNVSKEKITITHGPPESTPKITNDKGEGVYVAMPPGTLGGIVVQPQKTLQPRETVELYKRQVAVKAANQVIDGLARHPDKPTIMVEAGKFKIAFTEIVHHVLKMPTGVVEFEVKDGDENKPPEQKEAFTAWGKESGGLQAGLGLLPGAKRVYQHGETVTLIVRVRNVGKAAVKFEYVKQFLDENRPTVTDADGKPLSQSGTRMLGTHGPTEVNLEPGQEVVLETRMHGASGPRYALLPEGGGLSTTKAWPLFVGTGKFSLHYDAVFGNSSSCKIKLDPALDKLATGKLELEVGEPEKVPQDKKEAFAAWGKEVGGLQAGLMCVPSDKQTFRHRETITLVVRVRNVGKEVVKFQYLKQFLDETPLAVTDAEGMPVPHPKGEAVKGEHVPVDVALNPGAEMVLESRTHGASGLPFEFVPLWSGVQTTTHRAVVVGPGKFGVQFEQVLGNSSSGKIKLDPALEKLATGRLELEIGKLELPDAQPKPNVVPFTVKNATIDDVDEKAGVVSVSFGNKEKPTKLVNVPLDKGVRVVASHVLPGVANNLPFEWKYVERLKGKVVSLRLLHAGDGIVVVSIASGND